MTGKQFIKISILAFIAVIGLNLDLSVITSLEGFLIEGVTLDYYQSRNMDINGSILAFATFLSSFSGNSVLWLGIYFALWALFYYAFTDKDKRIKKYSAVAAIIFSLMYVGGFSINQYSSLITVTGTGVAFLKSLIAFTGITFTFYALLLIFFEKVMNKDFQYHREWFFFASGRKSFLLRMIVLFMCWLPYFFIYLPGIVNSDTIWQISQALGENPLSNHHSIFMTGLFGLFIKIGLIFNSANLGVMLFSIFQMLVCAVSFSYILQVMARFQINSYLRVAAFLFYALYPLNGFYAITMFKDTLFGIVFLLLALKTIEMVSVPATFFIAKKNIFIYSCICILLYLTRNNGLYIILILIPALFCFLREYRKKLLIVAGIIVAFLLMVQMVSALLNVQKGSIGEALSIPLQQIARTVAFHGDEIPDSDRALISKILPFERLPELYDPIISDPVKAIGIFDEKAFRSDLGTDVLLWARLFLKYPTTYIEAFLCQSHGYWYPDTNEGIISRSIDPNEHGIYSIKLVPSFVEQIFSGIFAIRVFPAVSMLLSIGFMVWVTIISAMILMLKGEKRMLLAFLPVFLLWLTCIASPVSGQFRYIYGLFLAMPLLLSITLQPNQWQPSQNCVKSNSTSRNNRS